jgi:hypothetical protein
VRSTPVGLQSWPSQCGHVIWPMEINARHPPMHLTGLPQLPQTSASRRRRALGAAPWRVWPGHHCLDRPVALPRAPHAGERGDPGLLPGRTRVFDGRWTLAPGCAGSALVQARDSDQRLHWAHPGEKSLPPALKQLHQLLSTAVPLSQRSGAVSGRSGNSTTHLEIAIQRKKPSSSFRHR